MVLGWRSSRAVAASGCAEEESTSAAPYADTTHTQMADSTTPMSAADDSDTVLAAENPSSMETNILSDPSDEQLAAAAGVAVECNALNTRLQDGEQGAAAAVAATETSFEEESCRIIGQSSSQSHDERAQSTAPQLFPSLASSAGGISRGHQHQQQPSALVWPPSTSQQQQLHHHQDKSKKMKRDRSGGNVTRIDVYPNGESYVTAPDGTTTKTMATIQPISGSSPSVPVGSSPIFQFTSNIAVAPSVTVVGGGGGESTTAAAQAATAALNFGKGFAPGSGAQGISSFPHIPPPGNGSVPFGSPTHVHPSPVLEDDSTQTNYPQDGASSSSLIPMPADAGESSSTALTINTNTNDRNNHPSTTATVPIHWQPQSQTST